MWHYSENLHRSLINIQTKSYPWIAEILFHDKNNMADFTQDQRPIILCSSPI